MVVCDDLHKLLLYQRLNLGYECQVCKERFYNRLDHLQHTSRCRKEPIKCLKCGKVFAHRQILHLHMQFHNLSPPEDSEPEAECITIDDKDDSPVQETRTSPDTTPAIEIKDAQIEINEAESIDTQPPKKPNVQRNRSKPKPAKKKVGLTKIKMEDCLRCDECSCIYIDEKDYYKHMRNFHRLDIINNMPIMRQRSKKKCRSCCKQCRGVNCSPFKKPRASQLASNLIFKISMRDNIKNRWTRMVSSHINEFTMPSSRLTEVNIKPDPDSVAIKPEPQDSPDLSHLLSQVEVKIKTEPEDD